MSKCAGCGATIQHLNPNQIGYIPPALAVEKGEDIYCRRCFELIHYNKESYHASLPAFNESFYQKLGTLSAHKALFYLIVDVLDLYGGFIPRLAHYLGDNPVIVLVNKIDLLPKTGFDYHPRAGVGSRK